MEKPARNAWSQAVNAVHSEADTLNQCLRPFFQKYQVTVCKAVKPAVIFSQYTRCTRHSFMSMSQCR